MPPPSSRTSLTEAWLYLSLISLQANTFLAHIGYRLPHRAVPSLHPAQTLMAVTLSLAEVLSASPAYPNFIHCRLALLSKWQCAAKT